MSLSDYVALDQFERQMIRVGLQELIDDHNNAIEDAKQGR